MKQPLEFIRHRLNSLSELKTGDPRWGVEVDIRAHPDSPGKLYVAHDPWVSGVDFDTWLSHFLRTGYRGTLVLNTKEDSLEETLLERCRRAKITNFRFLDTASPTLVRWSKTDRASHFFARVSHDEPVEAALSFRGKIDWLWVDCFDGVPLEREALAKAVGAFKLCLVSPELHGQPLSTISKFSDLFPLADAICTKSPEAWENLFIR